VQQIDFPFLPLISLAIGVNDLKNYPQTKDRTALLSCIALFSTDGIYCYQKFIAGSASSSCLLYVGLAVSNGVKMIAALNALHSQWSLSTYEERKNLILNAVNQMLWFCAWTTFALGAPTAGLVLIACAIAAPIFFDCYSIIFRPVDRDNSHGLAGGNGHQLGRGVQHN